MNPAGEILIGICLAAAIAVFFWSLDTVRRERATADLVISQLPRRRSRLDLRDTVDRVMQPIADLLSERNRRAGKVTLAEDLAKAGLRLTSSEYLLIQISLALGLGLFGLWVFGLGPPFLLLGWLGFIVPHFYMRRRQEGRQRAFNDQLGNMITLLSNALKTGYSLGQAIEIIAKKAPPPVSDEFEVVTTSIHFGTSVEDALAALVKRVQSSDLDFIVVAILLHRKVGGNLPEILDNIAETIRDRLRMKREMAVLTAHARGSATLISALPIVLGVLMYLITPKYFAPMILSPVGWLLIGIAGALVVMGNLLMNRLAKVDT
ncbi:MAG TPA: type II secretion system F family protein [Candidatus Dormibacteraeota bacterium]|nr:type II secretion system F family protein [Candidatus Dormibacteraeota bacterium]